MSQTAFKDLTVIVCGADGRMGQSVCNLLAEAGAARIVPVKGAADWAKAPTDAAVVIDFSTPEGLSKALEWCERNSCPLVSGTTGLTSKQNERIDQAANAIAILWAPNMSLGVTLLTRWLKIFESLKDWDYQIEEMHHRHKKDKPSGTGLYLQKELESVLKRPLPPILSVRGGGVFGVHKVTAMSDEETISLEHVALNRIVFARGALTAARWLVGKKPGRYVMMDVLETPS